MRYDSREVPTKPEHMVYYKPTKVLGLVYLLPLVIFLIAAIVAPLSIAGRLAIVGGIIVAFIVVMLITFGIDADSNDHKYERHKTAVKRWNAYQEEQKALPASAEKPDEILPANPNQIERRG